jgi:hypothetical protein
MPNFKFKLSEYSECSDSSMYYFLNYLRSVIKISWVAFHVFLCFKSFRTFFLSIKQKNQKLYTYKLVVLTELLTPGIGFKALIFGNNETPPTPAFIKGVEDGMLLFGKNVDGICGNVG